MKKLFVIFVLCFLGSCVGKPDSVKAVKGFELDRYLGEWHEIARLDHSFERGLSRVTAYYSLREDGSVRVVNRGYDAALNEWKEAEGRAYFVNESDEGYLKVSFFGPFYGSYVVFDLDPGYQYAMVSGPDTSYLWILSRTPLLATPIIKRLTDKAEAAGFDTRQLIWTAQD